MRHPSARSLDPENLPQQCAYQPSFNSLTELGVLWLSVPFMNFVSALYTICRSISFLRIVIVDESLWTERTVPLSWSSLAVFSCAAAAPKLVATSSARQSVHPVKILRLIALPLKIRTSKIQTLNYYIAGAVKSKSTSVPSLTRLDRLERPLAFDRIKDD